MSRILTDHEVTTLGEDAIAWSGLVPKGYEGITYGLVDLALGGKTMLLNKVPSAAHNIVSIRYITPEGQKPSLIRDIKVHIEKLSKNNQRYRHEIELKEPTLNPRGSMGAADGSGARKPVKKPNTGEENIINKVESDVVDANKIDRLEDLSNSKAKPSIGAENAVDGSKLNAQLVGKEIACGHAFEKHVLQQGEFNSLDIRTRKQFAAHIENIVSNPTSVKQFSGGRTAYWDQSTGTIVIRNPKTSDGGTAFRPVNGRDYFDNLR
ncbi:hypothetical protein PT276_06290 [Orbaceae bacterium ESL0721]|nr:hypothetical protein [Orbaceae bacterium ESL0721]